MSTNRPRVHLPTPRSTADEPIQIPEQVVPHPSIVAVLGQVPEAQPEIAVVAKRTLTLRDDGVGWPADIQVTLSDDYAPHAPLADGSAGTPRLVPEVLGYRSGTDV